jgi:hypothetical protein
MPIFEDFNFKEAWTDKIGLSRANPVVALILIIN